MLSHSQGVPVEAGPYAGYCLMIPLYGLQLDTAQYDISLYASDSLLNTGMIKKTVSRFVRYDRLAFDQQTVQAVAGKQRLEGEALYSDISCYAIGDEIGLTVTYNNGRAIITPGMNFDGALQWSVGGNVLGALEHTGPGRFIALSEAPFHGDAFVVVEDIVRDLVDTMGIRIFDACPGDIIVKVDGSEIDQYDGVIDTVYIDESPSMPILTADVIGSNFTGTVDWKCEIRYTRSGRDDTDTYITTLPFGVTWNLIDEIGSDVRGGQATVYASPSSAANCNFTPIEFCVRAKNASEFSIIDYIGNGMWYDRWVAKSEGAHPQTVRDYLQFNEVGSVDCLPTDVRHTPNASNNSDGGFGIYQLTHIPGPPSSQELWDWKANVDAGIGWLAYKQGLANSNMATRRGSARAWNNGVDVPVPTRTVAGVVFQDGTSVIIEHAVGLKKYNGESGGAYCVWDADDHVWEFNELNNPPAPLVPFDYVLRICSEVE